MKYVRISYNSFLLALTIATLCFKNDWLQMRVNTGYIFGGLFFAFLLLFYVLIKKEKLSLGCKFTILNLSICTLIGMIIYGFSRMQIVPATIIREGLHLTRIPFSTINFIFLIIVLIGFASIIITGYYIQNSKKF